MPTARPGRKTVPVKAFLVALLASALAGAAQLHAQVQTLKAGGSGGGIGSLVPVVEAFQARNPDLRVELLPALGSRGGIRAAAQGAIGIGIATRALQPAEVSLGVVQIEFARTPFVFATASGNRTVGFTSKEIAGIYAGTSEQWPDGSRLRLILRPPGDSDTALIRAQSEELRAASELAERRPGMMVAMTDSDSVEMIEKVPGALGTSTLGHILSEKRQLRALALDGVEPSVENARDGRYPMHKRFFLVIRPDAGPAVQRFVAFVRSAPAQEILQSHGHWIPADAR